MQESGVADRPAVPWTSLEIVVVVFLSFVTQAIVFQALLRAGWFHAFYGADLVEAALAPGDAAGRLASYRLALWPGCLATALQIGLTVALLRLGPGATPGQMGLTTRHAGRQVVAGLLFAVLFAPGAYAIQKVALDLLATLGVKGQDHPFTQLGRQGLLPAEWTLLILAAVVLAPLWEELVYRGLIQPWVIDRQPYGGPVALGAAAALTLLVRSDGLLAALRQGRQELLVQLLPLLVLLALVPVYAFLARRWPVRAGLFATAVLFAWVHVRVWPSPVPLLWLALGMGWLRQHGDSLVGCFVLHAAFNAIAVGWMLFVG